MLGISTYISAQMPSLETMESYRQLVARLEPSKTVSEPTFNLPYWESDTTISLRDEIYLCKLGIKWSDTPSVMKKDSLLFFQVKNLPNYQIPLSAKFGKKKPDKAKQYYENQRLSYLTTAFDIALVNEDKQTMDSILYLMVYYYRESAFLANEKMKEKYKESFIVIRQKYSNFLFECYKKGDCPKKDISKLFGFCINAYPDPKMARAVIDYVYPEEKAYLFYMGSSRNVQFEIAAMYYLSVLVSYNNQETVDTDIILRGYKKLFELPFVKFYIDLYSKNLKKYIENRYGIYP